jgi:hypothetical protein
MAVCGDAREGNYIKQCIRQSWGLLIMRAYKWRKPEALEEVLEKKLFPLSGSGMREFASWVRAREKAKELGWSIARQKVEHLI